MKTKEQKRKGQFYTPKLFADYAHKMISEQFGNDWKEKFVVWDNCCGEKALTRDYYFKELYCSTLEQTELENSKNYNPEATSFQYDFLNDDLNKLPEKLLKAFEENKPIIFFINPPYATASNRNETSKKGCAKTMINEEMIAKKLGKSSNNLYAQFLYRILMIKEQYNLTNVNVALFSPPLFLTGTSYVKFRKVWLKDFSFNNGVLFKASHFADVANNWGISFSIWNCGETADKNNFNYKLIDNIDGEIEIVGEKDVYNIDGLTAASEWAKEGTKKIKVFDAPNMTNAINIKAEATSKTNPLGKLAENALGYLFNNSNNVDKNTQEVAMFSSVFSHAVGVQILPINFTKCTALFSARRLVSCNWINWADEYLAPNINIQQDDVPVFKSALNVNENVKRKFSANALGSFVNGSNNVGKNTQEVAMFSSNAVCGHLSTITITNENFERCTPLFAARKLVDGNWVNHTDEYLTPKVSDNVDDKIKVVGEKVVYNADGLKTAKEWIKEPIKGVKVVEKPTMSSGLIIKEGKNSKTKIAENALGCFMNIGNNVYHNATFVALYSSADSSNSNGISILPQNFDRIMANFASRKLIVGNWINDKDEYLAPNTINDKWNEFVNDSIIYSLFHTSSNQSSLRQVEYKGKKWDIFNQFFFMSKNEIMKLANECSNDECYNDAKAGSERYVYKLLQKITLSPEAQAVLDYAIELTRKTFKYRKLFNENNPKFQINNWDSGFYQLKALWKEYAPDELIQFKELFKKLADKMRPMVYELGFLKK